MHPVDVGILLAFVAYSMYSGLSSRSVASSNLDEYFLAGRSLGGTQAGLSMAATQFAADTPLLVTGLVATGGIFALWRLWVYAIAFLFLGFSLAPCWRRASVLTDAELSEVRYGGRAALWLRGTKALYFGVVFNCTVLAMVLFAAVRIAEPFFPWHAWLPAWLFRPLLALVETLGVPLTAQPGADPWTQSADNLLSLGLILAITTFYSTTGGLRSVVRTDLVQLALALGGTALYAYYAVSEVGGFDALARALSTANARAGLGISFRELAAITPDQAKDVSGSLLLTLSLQWLLQMNADGTGYLAQRCMACRTERDATSATLVLAWVQIGLRSLLWIPIALSLLVIYPSEVAPGHASFTALREQTYVLGMAQLLPVGARGVLLAAMLGALASTLDTHLNWGASYLTNDLFARVYCEVLRKREASERSLVRVARLANLVIVVVALLIMTQLASIQGAWKVSLLLGAGIGAVLLLRWLWWRMNAYGELTGMLVATLSAAPLLHFFDDAQEPQRLLSIAALSTGAAMSVAFLTQRAPDPATRAFYQRVQPPGFWGTVAAAGGEPAHAPRRRLRTAVVRTLAASLSLFCTLVAAVTWLFDAPPPQVIPSRGLWIAFLLAVGASALLGCRRAADA